MRTSAASETADGTRAWEWVWPGRFVISLSLSTDGWTLSEDTATYRPLLAVLRTTFRSGEQGLQAVVGDVMLSCVWVAPPADLAHGAPVEVE